MDSTPEPKSTKDVLVARADEQLSHVYEQIARADEQLARVTEQLAKMESDGTGEPSPEPAPQPPREKPTRRSLIGIGLLLAACIFGVVVAALVSQPYRRGVKLAVTGWAPQLVSTSSLPTEKPPLPTQTDPPSVQVAAAGEVTAQAAPLAQTPPQGTAPTAAGAAPAAVAAVPTAAGTGPELTQSQTMTRDLAKLEQSIAELKTKQDQMASDYAKAIEQLKAKQEDMMRRLASVSVRNAAPRAPPPRLSLPRRVRERPLTPPVYWDDYYEPW
ncbi:MAG TPA: hypothetical protein VMU69_28200 [Bradyrhizobium sp.]|nr:hypothetical protein [Bradyrhizobium sp.]